MKTKTLSDYIAERYELDGEGKPNGGWTNSETFAVASWIYERLARMEAATGKTPAQLYLMVEREAEREDWPELASVDWLQLSTEYATANP